MYAAISPRDCAAALLHAGDSVVDVLDQAGAPLRSISAARYLARHPDTMIVKVRDGRHAIDVLMARTTMSMCLDMTLLLFDRDVSIHTKRELATELNLLLRQDDNRNYVLDLILSRPIPSTADSEGAVDAAASEPICRGIVESILICQERVRKVMDSWLLVKEDLIVRQAGSERVYACLSRYGVFRRLVMEATDTAKLDQIRTSLVIDRDLCNELDSAPRIILNVLSEYRKRLPVKQAVYQEAIEAYITIGVTKPEWQEPVDTKPRHPSAHAAYVAAVSQVEKISDLYAQSKDLQAATILDELIVEQRKHSGGDQYLVKSLCNVATRVGARGRPEVGLDCLMKALEYPTGIDSQLYFQIGTELRELGQFDQAVNCYERAKELDDGSMSDRIRLAMIRVTVARGCYQDALAEYLALPALEHRPSELCALGTLYRKMGLPQEARARYRQSLMVDGRFHVAYAGLAEIRKQTGKPHQAIGQYNALLRCFPDLDVASKKVYDLARSHLFRLTNQYDTSERILSDLLKAFPADRDVHLQFAKLLALRGDFAGAQIHFDKARRSTLQDLGELAFAKASKAFDSAFVRAGLATIESSLMPEEKGLARCIEAFDLITDSDFARAQLVLCECDFVNRLVRDFADVLRFHARRKVSGNFDYRAERSLCRVAKRSDQSLRRAVRSIANDDYIEADRLEAEFLLRVAA